MEHPTKYNWQDNNDNRNILIILIQQHSPKTCIYAVSGIYLEPKEEIILIVGPDYFYNDSREGDIWDDNTEPDAIE